MKKNDQSTNFSDIKSRELDYAEGESVQEDLDFRHIQKSDNDVSKSENSAECFHCTSTSTSTSDSD